MLNLNKEQAEKLFQLAGMSFTGSVSPKDISTALVELEKKLTTTTYTESEIKLENTPSILVVDDLELSIHQLSLLLTKSGYNVHIARSKEEALDQYKKHNYRYILLDLFMPDPEDGIEILKAFVNDDKTKENDTKVIIISGTDDKQLINTCFITGASEFIEKSPEWHKHILRYIRQIESLKTGHISQFITNILDQERKIISVTADNLSKEIFIQEMEVELASIVNSGFNNIIFDMKNIMQIDSKGIAALIFGYKLCAENKGCFKLSSVRNSVNETLSYVFLHNIINIYKDEQTALNSF